jgi:hypothetical protein
MVEELKIPAMFPLQRALNATTHRRRYHAAASIRSVPISNPTIQVRRQSLSQTKPRLWNWEARCR